MFVGMFNSISIFLPAGHLGPVYGGGVGMGVGVGVGVGAPFITVNWLGVPGGNGVGEYG
jgi:hypothetical protein